MLKGKKKQQFQASPKDLAALATYLDGYAALSLVDPERIRKIIKRNSEDRYVEEVWKEIGSDVHDISALPSSSEGIMKLSRRIGILKPLSLFLPLGLFIAYLALEAIGLTRDLGQSGALAFLAAFIGVYLIGFSSYIVMNRLLTRKVKAYYEQHMGEVSKQRHRIKLANQRLIDRLAMNIRARKSDPGKYKFLLLHSDYGNISVLHEDKNSVYTVTVKGKSSTFGRKEEQQEE